MKDKQFKRKERIFIIFLLIMSVPSITYRFKHPEMTQTQLLLNTFEAYREFFS